MACTWPARAACVPLLTDTNVYATPSLSKPSYLGSYTDPTFGTTVQRVTGDPGTGIPGLSGKTWGDVCRIGYSKRQPWNCDGTKFWLETNKNRSGASTGTSGGLFLDGATFAPLFDGSAKPSSSDCRWHQTDPALMYYAKAPNEFGVWNVNTGVKTVIATFSGYSDLRFGVGEGNCDLAGNIFAFTAMRTSDNRYVCFAYAMSTATKYAEIDTVTLFGGALDNATVNREGTRVIVQYDPENIAVMRLNATLVFNFGLPDAHPSHWDINTTDLGEQMVVGVAKGSPNSGKVIRRRLGDGLTTVLTTGTSYASHTSCRATGVANTPAITSYEKQASYPLYSGELIATMAGGLSVWRLCHTHNEKTDYESETRGCPDWTASRVVFSSNWHNSGAVQAYVCTIAPRCPLVP